METTSISIERRFCGPPTSGNGAPHVVLGWSIRSEGRRILCAAALHDATGRYLARSVATWITLR
jgi:hypothetical protein